jgi:hypothetical protein
MVAQATINTGPDMTEAEQFLRYILEHIWRDAVSRTVLQLAAGQPTLDWLMAFGEEAAETEDARRWRAHLGPSSST